MKGHPAVSFLAVYEIKKPTFKQKAGFWKF
jgi:hypothetical protein